MRTAYALFNWYKPRGRSNSTVTFEPEFLLTGCFSFALYRM